MLLTLSLALICATVESWTPSFERKRSVVIFFGKRLQKGMSEIEFGARPLDTKSFAVAEALVESLLAKSSKSSDRDIPAILNECETLCNISAKETTKVLKIATFFLIAFKIIRECSLYLGGELPFGDFVHEN